MKAEESLFETADAYTVRWTKGSPETRQAVVSELSSRSKVMTQEKAVAVVALMSLRMGWTSKADLAQALTENAT